MVVDSDKANYMDLYNSVVDKYPPDYLDVAHFQYYDDELKSFPKIKTDQDLMAMFERHSKKKLIIMFVLYRSPSNPYEPIIEWDFSKQAEPTREEGNVEEEEGNAEEDDDDEYLRNPEPQNEHVGVHGEDMYVDNVQPKTIQVYEKDPSYVVDDNEDEGGDESHDEYVDEDEDEEEEQCNEQSYAPSVEHDPNNPPMEVGSDFLLLVGHTLQ
jgi:hypothetical protein